MLFKDDFDVTSTEIYINSIVQSAEQRAATNSFNLPSESEAIKAMAIVLSKRAQQEAIIWFMDKLRENLNNPLINEAFPETIKLIESLEDFKAPNFSSDWRYAISCDFIKMPKNLADGFWVKNALFDDNEEKAAKFISSIYFGYELNRLISEKYNYRDIIRYFYTSPDFKYDFKSKSSIMNNSVKKLTSQCISILYMLTNEFFAVEKLAEKDSFRLLTYEEITSLDQSQWKTLGQLIKIKYEDKFDDENIFFKNYYEKNQDNLSKWAGNLLITLSQFDKINKDYQKVLEGKNDASIYSFYNVWQITSQIIDNIDYARYLSSVDQKEENELRNFDISIIKDCLDAYGQIQNKNYGAAIRKTMNVLEKISSSGNNFKPEFYLKKVKITFDGDKILLNNKEENATIKFIFKEKDFEMEISKNKASKNFTIDDYLSVKPFLRFIREGIKDDNYKLIKIQHPKFATAISKISSFLNLDEGFVIELLKVQSVFDSDYSNQDKLSILLNSSQYIYSAKIDSRSNAEDIKLKYKEQLFKLTTFFNDVLMARNEQDLANVIDSHALPPTSYKLKRKVAFSIDLNAYVGVQGSRILTNGNTSLKQQYTAGITAPIGFAFTWSTKEAKADNLGFTIDLVDLGNIVNHYLVSSTKDYEKDVHFSEVFSLSSTFIYSFRKTPFVLFAGVKFLPIKTSTGDNGQLINNKTFDATMFNIGIKIDIPLVNLWTKVHD